MTINTIREAVEFILKICTIRNRIELDQWHGDSGTERMYEAVKELVPQTVWNNLADPKASVRAAYQRILPGYKIYRPV